MPEDPTRTLLRDWMSRPEFYQRHDETPDPAFYQWPRLEPHLDATAAASVSRLIGAIARDGARDILDLMASFDSHLPDDLSEPRVTGLGLNAEELEVNTRLNECVIHDLNADPVLPFADDSFDLVINTVSVQYLTRPLEVFRDVARVLRPGGRHLVIFSNRMFAPKVTRIWQQTTDDEHLELVRLYFEAAGGYGETARYLSMGLPRPEDDPHAGVGLPSDPVFAVFARAGVEAATADDGLSLPNEMPPSPDRDELARRKAEFTSTGACPHCGEPMHWWPVTENPAGDWDHDVFVCNNDACPYLVRGWRVMFDQGNPGVSYRMCYDPESGTFSPLMIPSLLALKSQLSEVTWLEYLARRESA